MRRKAKASEITVGSKVEFTFAGKRVLGVLVEDRGHIGWKGRHLLRVRFQLGQFGEPMEYEIPAERVKLATVAEFGEQAVTRNKMRPVSPGEVLREQLEELGMSANALATALHVPANRVTGILNARRALTPDTALRLERFFPGTTAQFWLNLQTAYELRRAELEASKDIGKIRPYKAAG